MKTLPSANYTYDKIGQLTNADSSVAAQDRKYVYDAAWNLNFRTNNTTAHVFKVDGKNQVTNDWESYTATYDGNGNLTNRTSGIGGYDFTYDDENQLTAAQRPASWRIEFVYDGQGRLRKRLDYTWSGSWTLSATTTFIYDGKRVIQERNSSNTPTVSYTRGTDSSGSLEGAGGIGGLLGRSHGYSAGNWSTHNVYFADGNGNITYMLNASQTKVAEYRYDPFGETISSSGSLASANLYRFSSKMYVVDGVLGNPGLYYYGYRFYYPSWQRWLNRDPINENGGINLYGFVLNQPVATIDAFGYGIVVTVPRLHPGGDRDNGAERAIRCAVLDHKKKEGYTVCSVDSVKDANDQLKKCKDCIKELNLEGHGRGAGMWMGPHRNPEDYFGTRPTPGGGYDFHNVDEMFGGINFCKPCTIHLRGCSIASQDGYPELKQKIASLTGCTVDAYAVDCFPGTDRGLSAPRDGSKPK